MDKLYKNNNIVITLGAPNDSDGNLSKIALSRVSKTVELLEANPSYKLVITGGYGKFNLTSMPHGLYVKRLILSKGINEERILGIIESSNTVEDALFSKYFLDTYKLDYIIVVTSEWHIARAKFIFSHFFEETKLLFIGTKDVISSELEYRVEHEKHQLTILNEQGGIIVNGVLIKK